mgnify:CR=1 FL=1
MIIKDKVILIIGGTGALGKTLTRRWYENNEIIFDSFYEYLEIL